MNNLKLMHGALVAAVCIPLFTGCYKNRPAPEASPSALESTYANDQALAEETFEDVQMMVLQATVSTSSHMFDPRNCATLTVLPSKTIIDYGSKNVQTSQGHTRRGRLLINYNGYYADKGYTCSITFDNFYEDNNRVDGTVTNVNMGPDSVGYTYFNIAVDATISKADGGTLTVDWKRVRTLVGSKESLANCDFHDTGTGTTTSNNGVISAQIPATATLVMTMDCRWVRQGSIICTLPSGKQGVIDYGATATCENKAVLKTSDGITIPITLP